MRGPSDKAVKALAHALHPGAAIGGGPSEEAREAYGRALEAGLLYVDPLDAAHDPALGLDRSVCLRDVVEFMRKVQVERAVCTLTDVERKFGPPSEECV